MCFQIYPKFKSESIKVYFDQGFLQLQILNVGLFAAVRVRGAKHFKTSTKEGSDSLLLPFSLQPAHKHMLR